MTLYALSIDYDGCASECPTVEAIYREMYNILNDNPDAEILVMVGSARQTIGLNIYNQTLHQNGCCFAGIKKLRGEFIERYPQFADRVKFDGYLLEDTFRGVLPGTRCEEGLGFTEEQIATIVQNNYKVDAATELSIPWCDEHKCVMVLAQTHYIFNTYGDAVYCLFDDRGDILTAISNFFSRQAQSPLSIKLFRCAQVDILKTGRVKLFKQEIKSRVSAEPSTALTLFDFFVFVLTEEKTPEAQLKVLLSCSPYASHIFNVITHWVEREGWDFVRNLIETLRDKDQKTKAYSYLVIYAVLKNNLAQFKDILATPFFLEPVTIRYQERKYSGIELAAYLNYWEMVDLYLDSYSPYRPRYVSVVQSAFEADNLRVVDKILTTCSDSSYHEVLELLGAKQQYSRLKAVLARIGGLLEYRMEVYRVMRMGCLNGDGELIAIAYPYVDNPMYYFEGSVSIPRSFRFLCENEKRSPRWSISDLRPHIPVICRVFIHFVIAQDLSLLKEFLTTAFSDERLVSMLEKIASSVNLMDTQEPALTRAVLHEIALSYIQCPMKSNFMNNIISFDRKTYSQDPLAPFHNDELETLGVILNESSHTTHPWEIMLLQELGRKIFHSITSQSQRKLVDACKVHANSLRVYLSYRFIQQGILPDEVVYHGEFSEFQSAYLKNVSLQLLTHTPQNGIKKPACLPPLIKELMIKINAQRAALTQDHPLQRPLYHLTIRLGRASELRPCQIEESIEQWGRTKEKDVEQPKAYRQLCEALKPRRCCLFTSKPFFQDLIDTCEKAEAALPRPAPSMATQSQPDLPH